MRKGYVDCPGGQVHYRAAGDAGPWLVLLHSTPVSSSVFERALPLLGRRCRAVAFDTPGYGMSDRPDREAPRISDYVSQLRAALDGLAIDGFALYGSHTGAAIAIALHNAIRERVSHLMFSGVPLLTASELEGFARNLGEPDMAADGAHLTRMWQSVANLAPDPAVLEQQHMASTQALAVYDHFLDGLRAVAAFDMAAAAREIGRPVFVLVAEHDRLIKQVGRLAELNAQTVTRIVPGAHPQLPWTNPDLFATEICGYIADGASTEMGEAEALGGR